MSHRCTARRLRCTECRCGTPAWPRIRSRSPGLVTAKRVSSSQDLLFRKSMALSCHSERSEESWLHLSTAAITINSANFPPAFVIPRSVATRYSAPSSGFCSRCHSERSEEPWLHLSTGTVTVNYTTPSRGKSQDSR